MRKFRNRVTALWASCIASVSIMAVFLASGGYSAAKPAPDWVSSFMLSVIGIGVVAFLLLAGSFLIKETKPKPYTKLYGISTRQYFGIGLSLLVFLCIMIARASGATPPITAAKLATPTLTNASFFSPMPSPSTVVAKPKTVGTQPKDNDQPWGVQKQLTDVTWSMKVGNDDHMASRSEIYEALNNYRIQHGVNRLEWNDALAGLAQMRAEQQYDLGKLDEHAGFKEFTSSYDNMKKLGYWTIGENATYGYKLNGVHIIEWAYSDPPHDRNQLDPKWNLVGIAVKGTVTDLIFGR